MMFNINLRGLHRIIYTLADYGKLSAEIYGKVLAGYICISSISFIPKSDINLPPENLIISFFDKPF